MGRVEGGRLRPRAPRRVRRALRRISGPRQVGGDDGYQYALSLDGRIVASGMMRGEATSTKNALILDLLNGRRS